MWRQLATKQLSRQFGRGIATSQAHNFKVCVCGAAGGVAQPLTLLLKLNPLVTDLALYDIHLASGLAADLSHIDTRADVKGYCGPDNLKFALNCSDIVVIAAGIARKPGMQRSDLFKTNAKIVADIVTLASSIVPKALIAVITNPVNSLVPLAAEILKKAGVYDANRLCGITTLDVVRARTFIGEHLALPKNKIKINVIGGHSGITILPLFSGGEPVLPFQSIDEEIVEKLTIRTQDGGQEIVEAKAGAGSATLSMSYASSIFINALLMGLSGAGNAPIECAYVQSSAVPEVEYFSTPLRFGPGGIAENMGLPPLNKYESDLLKCLIPELKKDIAMGVEFAKTL